MSQLSSGSFSTITNIQFGSLQMKDLWFNAQSTQLPDISFAPPKVNTRSGALINLAPDTVEYNDLVVGVILDKGWKTYEAIYSYFVQRLNVTTGQFVKDSTFDLWVDFYDGTGKRVKKFWFYRCRLTSFGDMDINVVDAEDTLNEIQLTFSYDYMDFSNYFYKEDIRLAKGLPMAPESYIDGGEFIRTGDSLANL